MTDLPLVDDDYLLHLIDHYVAAARLAHRAGFQFIDIKHARVIQTPLNDVDGFDDSGLSWSLPPNDFALLSVTD